MRTDYFFNFTPLQQTPDSTQTGESFMQLNNQGFMGQQSIMSSEFEDNSVDSLVTVKTQKLRPRRKKLVIKSYKHLDSYLIVKKDSFAFLKNIETEAFTSLNFNKFISENDTNIVVYNPTKEIIKQDSLIIDCLNNFVSESSINDSLRTDFLNIKENTLPIKNDTILEKELTTELATTTKHNNYSTEHKLSGEPWLMIVLVAVLLLFAFTRMYFKSKIKNYSKAVLSYQSFNKMYKEQNTINLRLGSVLSLIYNISLSLILYYSIHSFHMLNEIQSGIISYLIIFGIVIAFSLFFISINKLIAFLFEKYNLINEIVYNYLFSNRFLGLVLLPIALMYPYLPDFLAKILLPSTWGIIVLSFIFRWFRGIIISFKYRVSYLYMILYLCTLEIIPLMFFVKEILSLY